MAEPIFILATVEISASALRRWLKSAPLSAEAFDEWPASVARGDSESSHPCMPAERCVADALVSYCVNSVAAGDGYLHCKHDESTGELHFAARFQYGHEAGGMACAIALCALLRGIATVYAAKNPSRIDVFDSGATLLCIEIHKKSSRVLDDPAQRESPKWFDEWITQDLGDPDSLVDALFPPLARALKKRISLGALRASPQAPHSYDGEFWTDGQDVFRWPGGQVVERADPKTFRKLTPGNTGAAFYADSRQVWYTRLMGPMVPVQPIEPNTPIEGWRPYGADGEPVLRCADTVWTVADIDYPDRRKTADSLANALATIESQGGIPTWEKVYSIEYLRATPVDGESFSYTEVSLFEDAHAVYVQMRQGLIRMEGAVPGMTTRVGDLYCNNGLVFRGGHTSQCQPEGVSLRHIGGVYYADSRYVYHLRHNGGQHDYALDLRVLENADPASFGIVRTLPNATISRDHTRIWIEDRCIPGADPDALSFTDSYFWTDGQHIYYCGEALAAAGSPDIEALSQSAYARHGNTVYYMTQPVAGADAASFVVDSFYEAHDQYRRYDSGQAVA
jgi:hypothetical protein